MGGNRWLAGSTAQRRVTTLPGEEFVERLLQHVLPSGFKRIRHYGLLAPAAKAQRLVCARALLAMPAAQPATREDVAEFMRRVAALDIAACPHCRGGRWVVLEQRGPQPCGPDGRAMDESCRRACRGPPARTPG
ncbi:transposase [Rubrivivax gelatinosus]|uniref:transposase n=1 Tax=Rubrivivax gelatinosus TaxID=28068 RepID=UPI003211C65D